ncbi:hypothetical protein VOI54_11155 [Tamlana sp. 2201CG12-4]|uniref:hypothetical protein n=1 Tax=Tamlana sp. 2201CG12-4 TaxID=3112582 RepID=UPI002DBF2CBA|nr:hypothetical protein [Tamlana sp. 2201CG12-4]MEC3907578.1 hypothetical protein [Tamlana sp. 2201CG12-4]
MKKLIIIYTVLLSTIVMAQKEEHLPYYKIPEYPETYTAGTVAARMVDGLGFRYYWATEGLTEEDLIYKASESGRTSAETIEHLYGLSKFIRNNVLKTDKDDTKETLSFENKRKQTLLNFKVVADVLRNTDKPLNLEDTEVPFWNMINGPIADALWHCGQVVMLRRASGNPFNSKVSVFQGRLRE